MSQPKRLPAYALIIAINGAGLQAPEPDAAKLYSTLGSLGIPPTSIDTLIGPAATRQNIIQKLTDIADSRRIVQDAPILIYFAGHGAQQAVNIPGAGSRYMEFIVPYDALSKRAQPIPDVTISALLGRIVRKKSKYITLFLDCCHASGGSRDDKAEAVSEFTLEVDPDELAELDKDFWSEALDNINDAHAETSGESRALSKTNPLSLRYGGVTSHVLVASCHETQVSQEYRIHHNPQPQGLFTTALIDALNDCAHDHVLWTVTHTGLFERIKMSMQDIYEDNRGALRYPQIPQCEGYHKDRPVFSTSALPHGSCAIAPIVEGRDGSIHVPIGTLGGVRPQTTFEIYDYPQGRLALMGGFRVANLSDSQALLNPGRILQLGPDAYALMCTPPTQLPVEMAGDFPSLYNNKSFQGDLTRMFGNHEPLNHFIVPVRSGQKVRTSYTKSRDEVEFRNIHDGVLRFRDARQAADALVKAAMFFHHLDQPATSTIANADMISIFIHELAEVSNADVHRGDVNVLAPRRGTAIPMHPTRGCTVPGSDASFGLQIVNNGAYDLFVYVFYFDPSDYSITPLYLPPTSNIPLPLPAGRGFIPLLVGRELTVGYGNSGAEPLSFTLGPGLTQDKGFIKVYYSTVPSEMGSIKQDGFEDGRNSRPSKSAYSPGAPFGSVTYPVTVIPPRGR